MADKKMVNEALDLLYGLCRKVALDGPTHDNISMAAQVIRADINKEKEDAEDKTGTGSSEKA